MKLLHLDSSILGTSSVSRQLSAAIVERLRGPGVEVTYRDLAAEPLPHLTGAHLAAAGGAPAADTVAAEAAAGAAMLDEFLAADTVVIGVALYNFTISTQLKAWVDRILIAGKTFRYTPTGPVGLAGGKRIVLAVARGGFYGADSPAAAAEHAESYLRTVFAFVGDPDIEVIVAEGVAVGPEQRAAAISGALAQVSALVA
ncbi:MAG: NAD(P)H-dependent oxidoreductase [Sphingomonadaceae bacterium]|nr:NAD(P)H-dependent oxidoreductase [Sphingomonadaceae bacterium]